MYGYNVHLREGHYHQHIKFTKIEHKPKKKVFKERRSRQEATIAVREWTSGGESSSSSSSDESKKNFTTCFLQGPSSSLHMCLLLRDVEVHDILGGIFELAQLLLETYISSKQL
jgi:hypothetical protein